jgi:hypothetical protein
MDLGKYNVKMWNGFVWLKVWPNGGLLGTQ